MKFLKYFFFVIITLSCKEIKTKAGIKEANTATGPMTEADSTIFNDADTLITDTAVKEKMQKINLSTVSKHELVSYAKRLIGIPYKYASTDPSQGFDCSGFITYVFNHFQLNVPRSSVDFTNLGQEINVMDAKEGDLILFTGTNDSIKVVGHMGIITDNTNTLKFIHSTSGRANGVTVTNFGDHYKKRFVKIIRIFSD